MTPRNNPAKNFLLYPSDEPHLAQLPPEQRAAVELATNHEGLRYDTIAAQLVIPQGTVKSRVNRAREKILKLRAIAAAERQQKAVA
jgi:DNA-directed RNA polymerase specialized sigma24 family protein